MTSPTPQKPGRARIRWIDAARAFAVLAVLVMHYRAYVIIPLEDYPPAAARIWRFVADQLTPVRMPLLLFMSGMLASTKLLNSTPGAISRGISSLYLNGVWTTIYFAVSFLLVVSSPGQIDSWNEWLLLLVTPGSNLWFVWALAFWAFLFVFLKRLPAWLVLLVFASTNVAGILLRDIIPEGTQVMPVLRYGLFFAIGVYGGKYATRFLRSDVAPKAITLAFIYPVIDAISKVDGIDRLGRVFLLDVRSIVGIGAVAAVLAICCRWNLFAKISGYIGRKTLPLFVCHLPLLWLVINNSTVHAVLTPHGLELAWPLLGVIYLTAGSLLIDFSARKIGAKHIFDVPEILIPPSARTPRTRA